MREEIDGMREQYYRDLGDIKYFTRDMRDRN